MPRVVGEIKISMLDLQNQDLYEMKLVIVSNSYTVK